MSGVSAAGCGFEPHGEPQCSNLAAVVVTLPASWGLAAEDVPTCATHLGDWVDDVQATARLVERER